MAAEEVTIEQCNTARISVFFDANVIIAAIRDSTRGGQTFARLNAIDRPLRLFSSTTLFEVAFARRGASERTLREDHAWLRAHATGIRFTERVGRRFDHLVGPASRLVRGRADLGDALLVAFAPKQATGRLFAIATNDGDFRELPVRVVSEFLPPRSSSPEDIESSSA
jgi:predicted nucleic acid-binding protein